MKINKKYNKQNLSAFTLAETLITIGIIGIVAAMTLPTLITVYKQKVTIERLRATYSLLSQAVQAAKKDHESIKYWNTGLSDLLYAETYILPYLKTHKIAKYNNNHWALNTLSTQYNRRSYYLFWTTNANTNPIFVMQNGSAFVVKKAQNKIWIVVDINGMHGPNTMGIDGFSFNIDPETDQLIPTGMNEKRDRLIKSNGPTTACVQDSSWQYYRGGSCAALLMKDNWQMTKDYPWIENVDSKIVKP